MLSGLLVIAALTLLNIKGTKESGGFEVVVTIAKVILLMWFVGGDLLYVDPEVIVEHFSTDLVAIGSTAAMVFITFFGFSAIAASTGEVKDPTRTIPRPIFISMGAVAVLYSLVVLVVIAANLTEYSESAMGTAARSFLGPTGGMVIVGSALFSMISASNASILAGSRVTLAMSQLGHLPRMLGMVSKRTRTPITALLLVGTRIGTFAMILPLEELAHFADCVLLIALILVNAALIQHRRRFPHLERPFRVPLVPLLPGLGILANFYLLSQIPHLVPVVLALGALGLGFLGFISWKGTEVVEEALPGQPSRVALERADASEGKFRVLVLIANPANVNLLLNFAAAIASLRQGHILAVRVVVLPEQVPPEREEDYIEQERQILELARQRAHKSGVPMTSLVRSSTTRRILGEVTDEVVDKIRTDIMLVKLTADGLPKRLLLPTARVIHAREAERYATDLAATWGGQLTLCSVVPVEAQEELIQSENARLNQIRTEMRESDGFNSVETHIVRHRSISEGIIEESEHHDGVVVGAAGQSFSKQILFGSIPEEIAQESSKTVIVIKHHHVVKELFGRVMSE